jgi:hypothetical protein
MERRKNMSNQSDPDQTTPNAIDNPPTHVDFSPPKCLYQSIATYTNPKTGHVFELTASGRDPEVISAYTESLKVTLEVRPDDPNWKLPTQEPPSAVYQKRSVKKKESDQEPAISLEIEVVDSGKLEPPFIVDFILDPLINEPNRTSPHTYCYQSSTQIQVTIHADSGDLTADLSGGAVPSGTGVSNPGNASDSLSGASGSATTFTLSIAGTGQYDLSGSYRTFRKKTGR